MRKILRTIPGVAVLLVLLCAPQASAQEAVVRAVLFYSPTCPHCHEVIDNQLPAIFDRFGGPPEVEYDESLPPEETAFYAVGNGTVQMLFVDVSVDEGIALYEAATLELEIPDEMQGVPRLVVGDEYFVGSASIPAAFPGIIEAGLESGGIDWPAIEGLDDALAAFPGAAPTETTVATAVSTTVPPASTATAAAGGATAPSSDEPTTPADVLTPADGPVSTSGDGDDVFPTGGRDSVWEKYTRDVVANTIAVAVLVGMVASLIAVAMLWRRGSIGHGPDWLIPVVALVGVGVAVYLTYVETSGTEAICGPVGNCNAVQQSKYAELFGFLHVGLVGVVGYGIVIGAWFVGRLARGRTADLARLVLFAGTVVGVAFSVYLTFLEPFVIGASCAWCLASAIIVTLLLWVAAGPAQSAWDRVRGTPAGTRDPLPASDSA